jgi:ADP-ribosyl-[dinitrogen reductase] hydrolase
MSHEVDLHDRVRGCLLGGAVGDAMGAPYEGLFGSSIPARERLLAGFGEFVGYPRGQWTDDTQLTLATVEAVVDGGGLDVDAIARRIARLWARNEVIGPGGACTRAAHALLGGTHWSRAGAPIGQAGNGAAMRAAPLGLLFLDDAAALAGSVADVCRITHQDPRAVAGGVAVAAAARHVVVAEAVEPGPLCDDVAAHMRLLDEPFAALVTELPAWVDREADHAAAWIAWAGQPRPELERPTITPFVVPTVLACLWALLRGVTWADAVTIAIRLGGDVDTTGAITGAIAGARHGAAAIPEPLASRVAEAERIDALAARFAALV